MTAKCESLLYLIMTFGDRPFYETDIPKSFPPFTVGNLYMAGLVDRCADDDSNAKNKRRYSYCITGKGLDFIQEE